MDSNVAQAYAAFRKRNPYCPASQALLIARGKVKPCPMKEVKGYGRHGLGAWDLVHEGFKVRVELEPLEDASLCAHGEFTDKPDDGAIRCGDPRNRREYAYWKAESGYTLPELAKDYNGKWHGMSKHVAWEAARVSLLEEAEADRTGEDYYDARVTIRRAGVTLAEAWQAVDLSGADYADQAREVWFQISDYKLDEVVQEARDTLAALCTCDDDEADDGKEGV